MNVECDHASVLVLACGALAHDIMAVLRANDWNHIDVQCLPADLHNTPAAIPDRVRAAIRKARGHHERIFVAYGDCGTGGQLDAVLRAECVERIAGAHCYEFLAGASEFQALAEEEPGTFYLTDFLARHFDRLVIKGLGIDRHPELMPVYFGNYRRCVFLSQTESPGLLQLARAAAARLQLEFQHRHVGRGRLDASLRHAAANAITVHG